MSSAGAGDGDELRRVFGGGRGDETSDVDAGAGAGAAGTAALPGWCDVAGDLAADGTVALCEILVRRLDTEPGPVPRGKREKLAGALGKQLAIWFPNMECPPWGEALLIATTMVGAMRATGTPIPKPALPQGSPPAQHVAPDLSSASDAAATSEQSGSPPRWIDVHVSREGG